MKNMSGHIAVSRRHGLHVLQREKVTIDFFATVRYIIPFNKMIARKLHFPKELNQASNKETRKFQAASVR